MFRRSSERYVILQDYVPLQEQQVIERAVVTVIPPVKPSQTFISQLSQDLVAEARRQEEARRKSVNQALRIFGIAGGGILSVLGGIVLWLLFQQPRDESKHRLSLSSPQQTASTG